MIKFMARAIWSPIKQVEVERETAASVWVGGRRYQKHSSFENYFDTWEDAKEYLVAGAEKKLAEKKDQVDHAQGELEKAKALKQPPKELTQ